MHVDDQNIYIFIRERLTSRAKPRQNITQRPNITTCVVQFIETRPFEPKICKSHPEQCHGIAVQHVSSQVLLPRCFLYSNDYAYARVRTLYNATMNYTSTPLLLTPRCTTNTRICYVRHTCIIRTSCTPKCSLHTTVYCIIHMPGKYVLL